MDMTNPIYADADKAREHLEAIRWPSGPVCAHCGSAEKITKLKGKSTRPGVYKCNECKKPFSVTVGTVFERSKIPLHKWVLATHLMAASKKGMSAHQLHRMIEVTYKTAWFMWHRIREAMRSGSLSPMGGGGGIVEVDETYYGTSDEARDKRAKARARGRKHVFRGGAHKIAVLTLVSREGAARSFKVDKADKKTVLPILRENLDAEARVITDDSGLYRELDQEYEHAFVPHIEKVWGRGEIHTNTIEGFYSIFKRGMKGVYQHCSERHLHRYLAEFDFRYSHRSKLGFDDTARAAAILRGAEGKRLTYC